MVKLPENRIPVLRRTIGSWSGGTRVEVVKHHKQYAECRVLAGIHPVIDVAWDDLVWRRRG